MAVESKEVSKFTSGLIGSSSETDIGDDFATFSLNTDSEQEKGALRGIKGHYILGHEGWALPRKATWRMRFNSDATSLYRRKAFLVHGYNKTFCIYMVNSVGTAETHVSDRAVEMGWELVTVDIGTSDNRTNIINHLVTALNSLKPPVPTSQASGINNYFTAHGVTDVNSKSYLAIQSNFLGDFNFPESPAELVYTDTGDTDRDLRTDTFTDEALNVVLIYYPDSDKYNGHTGSGYSWDTSIDGKFIRGTGLLPTSPSDETPLGFKFLKSMNEKGTSHLFTITHSSKAVLLSNLGKPDFALEELGDVATSTDSFDISAEQRNTNLYIGTGSSSGTKPLWFGKVDRQQLEKNFVDDYLLSDSSLETIANHYGPISVDNLVVPTLHYGLNSTNRGIAGSASVWGSSSNDSDLYMITSGNARVRTVNNWAKRCLTNSLSSTPSNYNEFKLGMIFRISTGGSDNYVIHDTDTMDQTGEGENVITHLRDLKGFAKGKLGISDNDADNFSGDAQGANNEALHDGDLFQIVYVPDAATIDESAVATDSDLIRFSYIGHLRGDNKTTPNASKHDSNVCFDGLPAYCFGHVNDSNELYRIRNTSRSESFFTNNDNAVTINNSIGGVIAQEKTIIEKIDLSEELGISNFKIGTIAECKSADGDGNFGGDSHNSFARGSYYAGYGKLWISNRDEYNKLYLVDITNWDSIDATRPRLSFKEIELNFDRIHDQLFATDYTSYGKGLVRLWYGGYGTDDHSDFIGDYDWINEPSNQFISGICETYSHKSHLGDGAAAGIGSGKWRVWVTYNKDNHIPHTRWDLFLFNFRPQGIGEGSGQQHFTLSSTPNDTQEGIGVEDNYTVYMYDKTPPYQEVAYLNINTRETGEGGTRNKIYYPYDKFSMSHVREHPPSDTYESLHNDGAESDSKRGAEWLSITGGSERKNHFSNVDDSQDLMNFRNPSGEFMTWKVYKGSYVSDNSHVFPMGTNIGWSVKNDNFRQWTNFRHCLKPHFKEWYFTGTGDKDSATELSKPVAHIVSFFGKLSGKFCTFGGEVVGKKQNGNVSWYSRKEGTLKTYDEDITMFTMHDSPVAFCTLTSTNGQGTATFSSGETQGAPYGRVNKDATLISDASIGGPVVDGDTTDARFKDTEAGFRTDSSVPATIGHSRFNQYRHHHDFNGSGDLNLDSGFDGDEEDRHGYCNTRFSDPDAQSGGQYYGQDGFGHYNMISTTWASNQEIMSTHRNASNDIDRGVAWNAIPHITPSSPGSPSSAGMYSVWNDHFRIFGLGFEKYAELWRNTTGETDEGGFSGHRRPREGHFQLNVFHSNSDKYAETRFGTGYLTYRWPHTEDPSLAGSGGNAADYGDYASHRAGYYSDAAITIPKDGTDPSGGKWDNRKTVWCWSTTSLTESVYKNVDYSDAPYDMDTDWEVLVSPRCSFRKLDLPSGYDLKSIQSVDFASWQKINYADNTSTTRHGYMINGQALNSPISNADQSASICMVIDNKSINKNFVEGYGHHTSSDNKSFGWFKSQSRAAVSELTPLMKQHKQNESKFLPQICTYTNNSILFKNLNPGLSDCTSEFDYWDRTFYNNDSNSNITKDIRLTPYSPLVIGSSGGTGIETVSNWVRPQLTEGSSTNLQSMGDFPCYTYDNLWNFWSKNKRSPNNSETDYDDYDIEAGFDNSVIVYENPDGITEPYEPTSTVGTSKRPTEGIGSTAGSLVTASSQTDGDLKYLDGNSDEGYNHTNNKANTLGAHVKMQKNEFLIKLSEEPAEEDVNGTPFGVEFKANTTVWYKFSYTYDGFQEGPLSSATFDIDITGDSQYIRLLLSLPTSAQLGLSPRVTHVNIYRKNDLKELYRLVKQVNLNGIDSKFQFREGKYEHKFNDEGTTVSYEGLNGVSETLDKYTPNYALSCQLNDFLFVSKIYHPEIEQGDHILLRS